MSGPKLGPPRLTRDAEVVAVGFVLLGGIMNLKFQRPHVIHPRMRAALDELTTAGLLMRTADRGGLEWRPTPGMAVARKFRHPAEGESFPFTVSEAAP